MSARLPPARTPAAPQPRSLDVTAGRDRTIPAGPDRPTVLVTGATRGIGLAAARLLAERGCLVLVHGRDEHAARAACRELGLPASRSAIWGDLADLQHVRPLAHQALRAAPVLDGVILNAGVFQEGGQISSQGFELDFAVNYLAQFLLVHLLMDCLVAAPAARVLFVSSSAYINGRVELAAFGAQHLHDPLTAYATSKVLCLMAALELARRMAGSRVCVNACNPGPTCTRLLEAGQRFGWRASGGAPARAARDLAWLVLSPDLRGVSGRYFNNRRTPNVPKRLRDPAATRAVYEASLRLCSAFAAPLSPRLFAGRGRQQARYSGMNPR